MKFITYPQPNGQVAVIFPAPNAFKKITISEQVVETRQGLKEEMQKVMDDDGNIVEKLVKVPCQEIATIVDEQGNTVPKTRTVTREEVVPLTIEEIAVKDVPEGVPYKIVDLLDIDDSYFNAYEFHAEDGAEVNIDKAKAIHLDKFRAARAPKLQKLDVDYMKAIEVEDHVAASAIAVKKQELRDVTKTPLPDTLPEIKETWPDILKP
jgi:hypothetical protein